MIITIDPSMSINDTISKMSENDILHLKKGTYFEKVKLIKSNITIIGEGKDTIISGKDYYNKIHDDNKEFLTVRTYTVLIKGDNVTLKNLTVRNESVPNYIYGQAVALEVLGDHFIAENINLISAQDTLLTGPLPEDLTIRYKNLLPSDELETTPSRQLYKNCHIEGDVDFIFGCGTCYFDHCELHSVGKGYISAPSHPQNVKYGYVFNECVLTSEKTPDKTVFLSRPWRDYGAAMFINCKVLGNHIKDELFNHWQVSREKTCRFYIYNTCDTSHMVNFAHELSEDEANKINQKEVLGF